MGTQPNGPCYWSLGRETTAINHHITCPVYSIKLARLLPLFSQTIPLDMSDHFCVTSATFQPPTDTAIFIRIFYCISTLPSSLRKEENATFLQILQPLMTSFSSLFSSGEFGINIVQKVTAIQEFFCLQVHVASHWNSTESNKKFHSSHPSRPVNCQTLITTLADFGLSRFVLPHFS